MITVAYLDSDVGFVEAATFMRRSLEGPAEPGHGTGLRDTARPVPRPKPALEGALDWSAAAGLTADPAGVRTALTGSEPFAEDLADRLLTALGLDLA